METTKQHPTPEKSRKEIDAEWRAARQAMQLGIFLTGVAIWGGSFCCHLAKDTWVEFPTAITAAFLGAFGLLLCLIGITTAPTDNDSKSENS